MKKQTIKEQLGVDEIIDDPEQATNVLYNPSEEDLREYASHEEITTEYGSPSYVSDFRSRSADRTKNEIDDRIGYRDLGEIQAALDQAADEELICLDRSVGRRNSGYTCRLYVPKEHARIALSWSKLLEPAENDEPDFETLQLPDWHDTEIRVFPEDGTTYVLGSDYTGEAKKSFLRQAMYDVKKEEGGIGLHAGSKRVTIDENGEQHEVGQLFLGLSGTGKSTLTSHGLWLDGDEEAEMLQDDVCLMYPDGTVDGTEGNGLFIKTIGLTEEEQPELYRAATAGDAVLENVDVYRDGTVDFHSDRYTGNSRAVIQRDDLESASEDIDLLDVDQLFFITRNPLMPPVARLNEEQAGKVFMLGESIETGAGDPDRAGEAVRVVGTNPFIMGPEGEEGNIFTELVRENDIEPYVINTGSLGGEKDIQVEDTVTILEQLARENVEWTKDETLDLEIPSAVPGMDIGAFHPADYNDDFEEQLGDLREERDEYLDRFDDLDREIQEVVY